MASVSVSEQVSIFQQARDTVDRDINEIILCLNDKKVQLFEEIADLEADYKRKQQQTQKEVQKLDTLITQTEELGENNLLKIQRKIIQEIRQEIENLNLESTRGPDYNIEVKWDYSKDAVFLMINDYTIEKVSSSTEQGDNSSDDDRDDSPAVGSDDDRDDSPAVGSDDDRDDSPAVGSDDDRDDSPAVGSDDDRDDSPAVVSGSSGQDANTELEIGETSTIPKEKVSHDPEVQEKFRDLCVERGRSYNPNFVRRESWQDYEPNYYQRGFGREFSNDRNNRADSYREGFRSTGNYFGRDMRGFGKEAGIGRDHGSGRGFGQNRGRNEGRKGKKTSPYRGRGRDDS